MKIKKPKKMSIGGHAKKMMAHPVHSEPSRSSGGHSRHAPFPLPNDHYHGTRPKTTKPKAQHNLTPYGTVPD